MLIFICILIGIIVFYKAVIPYIHNQYQPTTERKITKGLLSMSFWQILFSCLVCAYAFGLEPVHKQTDEDVSSFLQEYSEVGDLINEYTGINGYSNFNYLMSESQSLHSYATIFIIVSIIIALIIAIGTISKKLDRRIVEGLAILNTLACCWITKSSTDLYEAIVRDGVTLQAIAWIGRLLGTDIYLFMDTVIRSIWILPIILIIKHFYYHKTLNEYYLHNTVATGNMNNEETPASDYSEQAMANDNATETVPDSDAPANDGSVTEKERKEESPQRIESVEGIKEPIAEVKKEQSEQIITDDVESSSSRFWLIFGGIVIVGFISFLYWNYNNNADVKSDTVSMQAEAETNKYKERSEAVISKLTGEYGDKISVLYKYPELSKYCAFSLTENGTEYLLVYDLEHEILKRFENYSLQTINAGEVCLPYYSLSMNESDDKILLRGNNGANSIGYTEYLLELNPFSWKFREICSGSAIKESEDGYIVDRIIMTKWGTCVADSEYANIHIYYDCSGNLIPSSGKGETFSLAGVIDDKYAITMSLSFHTNGNIYGTYYYNKRGSDNKLYLYGGASANEDMVLLEFTESGQQTGIFKGRLTSRALEGTFTNNAGVEMPFELYLSNGSYSNTTLKRYYNSRFGYSILYHKWLKDSLGYIIL